MEGSFISELKSLVQKASILEVNGVKYANEKLYRIVDQSKMPVIKIATLSGLTEYIKANVDSLALIDHFILIDSYRSVSLFSSVIDKAIGRDHVVHVELDSSNNQFEYGRFMEHEEFIIKLKSLFKPTIDQENLLSYVSKLTVTNSIEVEDDGVTQVTSIKKGSSGALRAMVDAPSIVELKPYRTFREVEQPHSDFLFRMRGGVDEVPQCALFEADGGSWKNNATAIIQEYLREQIKNVTVIR